MTLEEDDIFKNNEMPLGEDEDEEMEDEDEELDSLEKDNEEEDDIEDDEEEVEAEGDVEGEGGEGGEGEGEGEGEEEDEEEEDEDTETRQPEDSPATSVGTKETAATDNTSKVETFYRTLKIKAKLAESYDITPKVAIPHATGINTFVLPRSSKWLFTGGDDGYIRKFDFFASIDGELQLTSAQRHSLVDLITNAGIIMSYWDNEIPVKRSTLPGDTYEPKLSPVYSLAVEDRCLWILSGLSNGGINMQSVRHNEGTIVHSFQGHTSTVSVLQLNQQQDRFLSGSWDNLIHQWDLNTGDIVNSFKDSTGQVSSIQYRPSGGITLDQIQQAPLEDDDMDSLFGDEDDKPKEEDEPPHEALDDNVFLSSAIDGSLYVWDVRSQKPALRLKAPKGTPPWCVSACWSQDGNSFFAGRRNSCVEEFSLKMPFDSNGEPNAAKVLRFPSVSGAVTTVTTLPNDNQIVCGSFDNIRLYDLRLYSESHKKTPFLIIPGHHGGTVCDIKFDSTYRYMISASGNRGWQGTSIENMFVYEVGTE